MMIVTQKHIFLTFRAINYNLTRIRIAFRTYLNETTCIVVVTRSYNKLDKYNFNVAYKYLPKR